MYNIHANVYGKDLYCNDNSKGTHKNNQLVRF